MAAAADKWTSIEIAFRAGDPPQEITERFGVTLRELFARARASGWKHGDRKQQPAQSTLPVVVSAPKVVTADEKADDVTRRHQEGLRQMYAEIFSEVAELQQMRFRMPSFCDERIQELERQALETGDFGKLHAHCLLAARGSKARIELVEKLARSLPSLIEAERSVCGLSDKDSGDREIGFEDMLADLQKPLEPRELPDNVVDFERRIAPPKADKKG